jgi:ubiquinone/menaquinone biosynthesis C-methylase UbiE
MLKHLLSLAWFYQLFQDIIGGTRARQWTIERFVTLKPRDKLLDVGCGPGDLLRFLPKDGFEYVGIDISEDYLEKAKRTHGHRARFLLCDCGNFPADMQLERFDWVLCMGLLHHLDDSQCASLFDNIKSVLAQDGKVVCLEPTFFPGQNPVCQFVMKQDRGKFIRTLDMWMNLYESHFESVAVSPLTGAFRIPYEKTVAVLAFPK